MAMVSAKHQVVRPHPCGDMSQARMQVFLNCDKLIFSIPFQSLGCLCLSVQKRRATWAFDLFLFFALKEDQFWTSCFYEGIPILAVLFPQHAAPPASETGFSTGGFFMILTFPILPCKWTRVKSMLSETSMLLRTLTWNWPQQLLAVACNCQAWSIRKVAERAEHSLAIPCLGPQLRNSSQTHCSQERA